MSEIRVATWNAEGMFVEGTKTRRATPHDALVTLRHLDADIVVIPEFGRLSDLRDEITLSLEALGYEVSLLAYDEPRTPGLGFAILSRLKVVSSQVHDLAGSRRQLLEVVCKDATNTHIRVLGVHLDDRTEEGRLREITAISDVINAHENTPTLLLGDFNAMHRDSRFAKLVRSGLAGRLVRGVAHPLISSMAGRTIEMASGTTIEYIQTHTHLKDMDPGRKRTISSKQAGLEWAPSWRLAKIDWIFGSKHFTTRTYRVLHDVGSDHRPVIASLHLNM